jgi:hypothetical protein
METKKKDIYDRIYKFVLQELNLLEGLFGSSESKLTIGHLIFIN